MKKKRLDELVVEQGLAETVDLARRLIMAGQIRSGDRVWEKAGEKVPADTELTRKDQPCRWVSRGGLKLEKAFSEFSVTSNKKRCLDIGASTGGFTHVLLEFGAAEVVAVDVGWGQLDQKLLMDSRVTVKDRTNFRLLAAHELGEPFDLVVADVSFISLRKILPKACEMLKPNGEIVALIKPQFEAPRGMVPEGGIITDERTHLMVVTELAEFLQNESRLILSGLAPVPLVSRRKNIEFVAWWTRIGLSLTGGRIKEIISAAHQR